jgi:hypothetical protein
MNDLETGGGPQQSTIQLPPVQLTVPAQPEQAFPMHYRDWDRLYRCVAAITTSPKYMSNLAWTLLGIGAASILAWIPWQAVFTQLPNSTQLSHSWVSPLLVVVAISCGVMATFAFAVAKTNAAKQETDTRDVLDDMEEIHRPSSPIVKPSPVKLRNRIGEAVKKLNL